MFDDEAMWVKFMRHLIPLYLKAMFYMRHTDRHGEHLCKREVEDAISLHDNRYKQTKHKRDSGDEDDDSSGDNLTIALNRNPNT